MAAYAGIGIAGFILTIFAVVALLGLKRRRRRAKEDTKWEARHEAGPGTQSGYGGGEVAELQGTSSVKYESRYPKRDHVELVEMKSPVEVDVWHPNPQELDGKEWKGPQKVYEIGYPEK